jgi:internalin A
MDKQKIFALGFIGALVAVIVVILVITAGESDTLTDDDSYETSFTTPDEPTGEPALHDVPVRPVYIHIGGEYFYTYIDDLDLRFSELTDECIQPLRYMTNLTRLVIGGNEITDLSPLAELTDLTVLAIWTNSISDLLPLAGLVNLEYLYAESNYISDISVLAGLYNLHVVHLQRNQISDLSPLANHQNLRHLFLDENNITDISPLAGLNLVDLDLGCNTISDFSPLSTLLNLTWLDLHQTEISDLSFVTPLYNLQTLNINGNLVSDLSPLVGSNITYLIAHENLVSDLSPVADMPNLAFLGLFTNQVSDLSPIANATNLRLIGLGYNQISDISPLTGLVNLEQIGLRGNHITTMEPVAALENLVALDLTGNQITSVMPPASTAVILDLDDNPITDWSPLNHIMIVNGRPQLSGLVVYALSQDMFLQAQPVGLSGTGSDLLWVDNLGWNPFLIQSGSPVYTVVEGPYGNAVHIGERENTWYALDIGLTQYDDMFVNFEEHDYSLFVRGRNASDFPVNFAVAAADGPWNWLDSTEAAPHEEFTLTVTLSLDAFEATDGGSYQFLQRGFRLQTDCSNPFIIYEAKITRR